MKGQHTAIIFSPLESQDEVVLYWSKHGYDISYACYLTSRYPDYQERDEALSGALRRKGPECILSLYP